ncbi:MAG: glycosyl hydrolase family protein [Candidatus Dadabacteria bacterium]|nr:MAG: glycosyl hydrolase family protein [Candidatus Dadabacteria bacterium]
MTSYIFPDNFRFGVSDADLQVIGERHTLKHENSRPSMWTHFAKTSGRCLDNQTPEEGVDRYHRWQEDIELLKTLEIKHYRTSVSMARIFNADGDKNPAAIKWYRDYFSALKNAGIRTYACLYHWELPQRLAEEGGWCNRDIVDHMAEHARVVTEELGDLIDEYFLINEPMCIAFLGYHSGEHAPGERSLKKALAAAHNVLLASGAMFETIVSLNPRAQISACFNMSSCYAADCSAENIKARRLAEDFNLWFSHPTFLGRYPEVLLERVERHMPEYSDADMKQIQIGSKLSALAINYYRGDIIEAAPESDLGFKSILLDGGKTTGLGWPVFIPPVYPRGLYDLLLNVYRLYEEHGLNSIYVSENGMALETPWDGKSKIINDPERIEFLSSHIAQVYDAIKAGAPVKGYFVWTLLDNYEWAYGYAPYSCFGLVHVERPSMQRILKRSAFWYRDFIREHGY